MPKFSYADDIQAQAWNLLSVLIERAGKQGVQLCQNREGKPYLQVCAKLSDISKWATQSDPDSKLTTEKVRQLLKQHFGEKFLGIMTDQIENKRAGRGAQNWKFKILLWSKNLKENEKCFNSAWSAKKNEQPSNFSQVSNSNHQSSCEERYDVFLCYDEKDEKIVKEIEAKLSIEGIKVRKDAGNRCPGQSSYKTWKKETIEKCNSVGIFVSSLDSAPWQDEKKLSLLNEFYRSIKSDAKKRFPIPVLLPNAPLNAFEHKSAPPYLKGDRNAVDLTKGVSPEKTNDLIYGITGEDKSKKRKFLTLMSYNDEDVETDKFTTVVVSTYPMTKSQIENQFDADSFHQKAAENLLKENTNNPNINDVKAYISITYAFSDNKVPMPEFTGDSLENQKNINFYLQEKGNRMLMGLSTPEFYSLQKDKSINSITRGQYFHVETKPNDEGYNLFWIKCARFYKHNELCPDNKWTLYRQNQNKKYDHALFAKFEAGSKTIMVFGGLTAIATERLAFYFRYRWEDIYDKLKAEKGGSLNPSDAFAVVIKIPGVKVPDDELDLRDFEIVQICIRKNA